MVTEVTKNRELSIKQEEFSSKIREFRDSGNTNVGIKP